MILIRKYVWEVDDIEPGQIVTRLTSPPNSDNLSFMASVSYKICWHGHGDKQKWAKVAVTDGMIFMYESKKRLIDALNTDDHGYRPILIDDYIRMMSYLRDQAAPRIIVKEAYDS